MKLLIILVTFCLASTQAASAQGNPRDFERPGPAAERQAYYARVRMDLHELLIRWQHAWQRDDAAQLAAFYADDASFLPSGAPAVHTRNSIRAYFTDYLRLVGDVRMQIVDFGTSGDLAYLTVSTTYHVLTPPAGSTPGVRTEVIVLRRRSNGDWTIATHLSRDEPDDRTRKVKLDPDAGI